MLGVSLETKAAIEPKGDIIFPGKDVLIQMLMRFNFLKPTKYTYKLTIG